jgi:hypothetical protein
MVVQKFALDRLDCEPGINERDQMHVEVEVGVLAVLVVEVNSEAGEG